MTLLFRGLLFPALLISLFFAGTSAQPSSDELVQSMFSKSKKINTLSYRIRKTERINGEMITQISSVKLDRKPYRVYSLQSYPNDGLEVLYVHGENSNKAVINPNSFPWINLNLDPYGSIMRKDQHHTIHDAGFDHFVSILEFLFAKYGEKTAEMLQLDEIEKNGRKLWQVAFTNPYFKFVPYTTGKGESVHSIARRFYINSYTILERNSGLDHSSILPEGKIISIPNDYSPKMILQIDKELLLPVMITVFDDRGLFEQFEFSNINIDPAFDELEFSTSFPKYNF